MCVCISRIYEILRNVGIALHATFQEYGRGDYKCFIVVNRYNLILFISRVLSRKLNISWLDLFRGTYYPLDLLARNRIRSNALSKSLFIPHYYLFN